ncbi:MAG: 8-oxoguanine deaminase, partial [Sneathiella sp.]
MPKSTWIKNPLACLANNAGGGIVIRGSQIIECVPTGRAPVTVEESDINVFDASDHVVLPGLINTHHHFYQTLTRACPVALNKPLFPWLQSLYPIWAELNPEMMAVASKLALAESLLSGCTTIADHHYLFPKALSHAIDIQVEQVNALGVRAHLTRGSMSLGVDQGGLPPQSTVQSEDVILADSERLIREFHDPEPGAMVQIA